MSYHVLFSYSLLESNFRRVSDMEPLSSYALDMQYPVRPPFKTTDVSLIPLQVFRMYPVHL